MGDSPSQTQTSTPTLDPDIKARLLENMDVGNAITSGILPQLKAATATPGTGGSTPIVSPTRYGQGQSNSGNFQTIDTGFGSIQVPGAPQEWVNADGTPYKAPTSFTAGFTPDQLDAFKMIKNLPNAGLMSPQALGRDTFNDIANFKAPDVTASSIGASPVVAGQVAQVGDVNAKNFTDYDLSKYLDPTLAQTVDPVKAFLQDQGDRALSAQAGQSRAAGALRGSNRDVAQALTSGQNTLAAGAALSPLYQNAWNTTAGLVTGDANRNLTGQQSNQSTQLTRATTQAGLDSQASALNAENALKAAGANQDAALKAGLANQDAAISGAGVRNAGAVNFGLANKGAYDALHANSLDTLALGDKAQALEQSKIDDLLKALNIRNSLVTGAVPAATGQTTTTSGGGSGAGGILGGLGALGSGLGAMGVTV